MFIQPISIPPGHSAYGDVQKSRRRERRLVGAQPLVKMSAPTEVSPLIPLPQDDDSSTGEFSISAAIAEHGGVQPPNSQSHYALRKRTPPYFEGWYLRAVTPDGASYSFIYAIEAPGKGVIQVIDPSNEVHIAQLGLRSRFQASKKHWQLSHWGHRPPYLPKPLAYPDVSSSQPLLQGWQVDYSGTHGSLYTTSTRVQWMFNYQPTLGWGPRGSGRHTGTWLAAFPIFEPGYQVLMAHGKVSTGYITVGDKTVDLKGSTVYAEKNWGKKFPPKWFWMQANTFPAEHDLCVVAVGARRKVIVTDETIGMVAIHLNGKLYEFANWSSTNIDWRVSWGEWNVSAKSRNGYSVTLTGRCSEAGVYILGPTEHGMAYTMRDTMRGNLHVCLRDVEGNVMVDAHCPTAQLETGGEPWEEPWEASVAPMTQPLRAIVNAFNEPKVNTD